MTTQPGMSAIQVRPGHPDFLDLPWSLPLAEWRSACTRIVDVPRGLSRHEVVFASYGQAVYAFKELSARGGEHEYDLLRTLEDRSLPAVVPVGHAHARVGPEGEAISVLITRFLDNSLPYRTLFMTPGLERYRERLLDAVAILLVRIHLAGFYWGDCSLSNTLFRRDASELQAYFVDAETSEAQDSLSDGMRAHDLEIMEENLAGELADLAALVELPPVLNVGETGSRIRERYQQLWNEITREETLAPDEGYRIHERIRALNALGFSVDEVELEATGEGNRLRMRTIVTDRDYHRHQLHSLTGVVAEERQAALMLNEIREMRALLASELARSVPMSAAAFRWLTERFEPAARRLAPLIGERGDAAELYCQVLEHKWFLSERAHRDVGLEGALTDYLAQFEETRVAKPVAAGESA